MMATLLDEFNAMKIKVAKAMQTGNEAILHEPVHVVYHTEEAKRKRTNPSRSTRIIFNCRTPEQWKEMHAAKEPYFEIAVDPHVAVDCIIRALNAQSRETIAEWIKQGFEPGQPPPKAEIPECAK